MKLNLYLATAIYGLIIGVIYNFSVPSADDTGMISQANCAAAYSAGYAYFFGGLAVGLTNLVCGISLGVSGSNCAIVSDGFTDS